MTEELIGANAALASLIGLSHWARSVPTRAWGDGTPDRTRAWAIALGTMVLQGVAAVTAAGPTAGVALVIAAWMALGWLLVLAMNLWPQAALRWAWRMGALGGAGCVVALGWLLVRG
jgi:hypothetical protein